MNIRIYYQVNWKKYVLFIFLKAYCKSKQTKNLSFNRIYDENRFFNI
jgi:hypothetical protein